MRYTQRIKTRCDVAIYRVQTIYIRDNATLAIIIDFKANINKLLIINNNTMIGNIR